MEQVALSLQKTAVERRSEPDAFDQFGRSAFNRYYYSVFLLVRAVIIEFNPSWSGQHAAIPEMLTGSIEREISNFRERAVRRRQKESVELCNKAIAALSALSSLMKAANTVRVTADYNPGIKVSSEAGERFSLGTTSITDAHNWLAEAKTLTSAIRRAWRLSRGGV